MVVARRQWEEVFILVRSIGRQVPLAWVAKEFRNRRQLQYESEAFALAEDDHLIWFQSTMDYEGILLGGPWFVVG